ncbi:hypothetical protein EO087_07840 [Dyella sp. M7H15-1]|uniref:hypothetical protein n=1 Tax=Dyella sp. M7H15-1 TaxID=2501295 RepID=UPI001004E6DF|nr:hypothetical protein [Dyella sp. M7H15-1]QAU23910.1 hypothetical protein EO087_07840 [Dyella sp. M7H15-1]
MFDGFWSGIIGGLLGPFAIHYLRRFRLAAIFVFCIVVTPLAFFILGVYEGGWVIAVHRILSKKFFGVLLVGAVLGALAAFAVWVCTKLTPHESTKERSKER